MCKRCHPQVCTETKSHHSNTMFSNRYIRSRLNHFGELLSQKHKLMFSAGRIHRSYTSSTKCRVVNVPLVEVDALY